jgi:uncharacterized protein (TIGR03000 family)
MIDNFNFGDRAMSIICMCARSPGLKGETDMFRRMVTRMEILALAGLGLLLAAGPAKAQQGWPYAGDNWSYHWGSSGRSSYRSYSPNYYATSPSSTGRYSSYSYATYPTSAGSYAPYQTSQPWGYRELPVFVNLRVPSDAKIWIDGSPTKQTGTTRSFESPPVAVGPEYGYQIRIQWNRDGKDVTQTRKVTVHAGDVINLTLGSHTDVARAR